MLTAKLKDHAAWFEPFDEGYGRVELEETDCANRKTAFVRISSPTAVFRFLFWMPTWTVDNKGRWLRIVQSLSQQVARGDLKCTKCSQTFTLPLSANDDLKSFEAKCEECNRKHTFFVDGEGHVELRLVRDLNYMEIYCVPVDEVDDTINKQKPHTRWQLETKIPNAASTTFTLILRPTF